MPMSMLRSENTKTGKKGDTLGATDSLRPLIKSHKRHKVNAKLHLSKDSAAVLPS